MERVLQALRDQQDEFAGLLDALVRTEADWARQTPCVGWTVADVVLHVAQSNEMAIASARGQFEEFVAGFADWGDASVATIDDAAEAAVVRERGAAGTAVARRWRDSAATMLQVFSAADPHLRVTWVAGTLSVLTLATARMSETWIHAGDIADAFDVPLPPTDRLRLVARLAWRTLPYAFARAGRDAPGPVAFHLVGPHGDRWDFDPPEPARTTISGPAVDLCRVAGRRADPADTALRAEGPDGDAVLDLVRTFA